MLACEAGERGLRAASALYGQRRLTPEPEEQSPEPSLSVNYRPRHVTRAAATGRRRVASLVATCSGQQRRSVLRMLTDPSGRLQNACVYVQVPSSRERISGMQEVCLAL